MDRIDTHVHVGTVRYEPVDTLLHHLTRENVQKAVLIQYGGNFDNRYILECVRRFSGRFAAVVIVDSDARDALDHLERWASEGAQGIRMLPHWRSPGNDPLAIWRKAAELGLVVSCQGTLDQFASKEFRRILTDLDDLPVIIEHLGQVGPVRLTPPYSPYRKVLALAGLPNVYMKIPGFGEFCQLPFPFKEVPPFVDMALDAFGPTRLMWGSDWPRVSSFEGYRNALQFAFEYIFQRDKDASQWIFGKTAELLFDFGS